MTDTLLRRARAAGLWIMRVRNPSVRIVDDLLLLGPDSARAEIERVVDEYEREQNASKRGAI